PRKSAASPDGHCSAPGLDRHDCVPAARVYVRCRVDPETDDDRKPLRQNLHARRPFRAVPGVRPDHRRDCALDRHERGRARTHHRRITRPARRQPTGNHPRDRITPVSRRLTWVFVLGVALSLMALIASSDQDAIANLLKHDVGSLALKLSLVIFLGGLLLTLFHERLSKAIEAMLFWAVIGLLLVVG